MAPIRGYSGRPSSNHYGNHLRTSPSNRLLMPPVIHAPKPVQTCSLKAEHGGHGLIFVGSSKNGACWGAGATTCMASKNPPTPRPTSAPSRPVERMVEMAPTPVERRGEPGAVGVTVPKTEEGPSTATYHDSSNISNSCDSSHSTHGSDPANSDNNIYNNRSNNGNRRILLEPNMNHGARALHDDDDHRRHHRHSCVGDKESNDPPLIKYETRYAGRNDNNVVAQYDDDPSQKHDQNTQDLGNERGYHDDDDDEGRFSQKHQQAFDQQNAGEDQHSSNRPRGESSSSSQADTSLCSNAADVLVVVSPQSQQHPCEQDTYQRDAYKFETPPLDDSLDELEKERRRRALALEQQQMILQRVQAARADKKASSCPKKSSSRSPRPNVIQKKHPAATTTTTNNSSTSSRATSAVQSTSFQYKRPQKSQNPRTRGKLYRRLLDGSFVEGSIKDQRHQHQPSKEVASNEGSLLTRKESLEEIESERKEGQGDTTVDTPARINAWHEGPPSGIMTKIISKPEEGSHDKTDSKDTPDSLEEKELKSFVASETTVAGDIKIGVAPGDQQISPSPRLTKQLTGETTPSRARTCRGNAMGEVERRPARKPNMDDTKTSQKQGGRKFGKPVNGRGVKSREMKEKNNGKDRPRRHPVPPKDRV